MDFFFDPCEDVVSMVEYRDGRNYYDPHREFNEAHWV